MIPPLVLLALAQLMFSLDINIVFVALPEIGAELGFSDHTLQWVVSAYAVFAGGFLLLGGRAADLLGRRRMFVTALWLYGASSLVGGLAGSQELMIGARGVQGIGAALLLPSTLSLIGTLFAEGPARNRALAVWGGAGASGLTLGALLGGVLTDMFGWSAVFFVNVPLAAFIGLAALRSLPGERPPRAGRRFDLPGAVTVTAGATLLVYVLVQGPAVGWFDAEIVVAALAAVALLAAFAVIEARSADPLMPPQLVRNRSLRVAVAVTFVFMGSFGAVPYFLTVLFQTIHGGSPLETGLAFLLPSLAIAGGTQLGEQLVGRIGTPTTLVGGFLVGAAGTALIALGYTADGSYLALVPALLISGVAHGVVWTAMWVAASSGVEAEQQGVASGMASTALNIGNAVGLAVLVGVSNAGVDDLAGEGLRVALADGGANAVLLAAADMALGAMLALTLVRQRQPAMAGAA